jgi:hypothetical protein
MNKAEERSSKPGQDCALRYKMRTLYPAILGEAFLDLDVDAKGAVVIAQRHNGNIAIDVVLDLNHLLLR